MNQDDFIKRSTVRINNFLEGIPISQIENSVNEFGQIQELPNVIQHYYLTLAEQLQNTLAIEKLFKDFPNLKKTVTCRVKLIRNCSDDNEIEKRVCEIFGLTYIDSPVVIHNCYSLIRMTIRKKGRPKISNEKREENKQKHKLSVAKNMEKVYTLHKLVSSKYLSNSDLQSIISATQSSNILTKIEELKKIFTT